VAWFHDAQSAQGPIARTVVPDLNGDFRAPCPGSWVHYGLDNRGRPKRRPRSSWLHYTVENILRNEAYHGTLVYNRTFGRRFGFKAKTKIDIIRVEDAWEHFVPDNIWYQCQLLDLETSSKSQGPASVSTFVLPNVICMRCGYGMSGWTVNKYKVNKAGEKVLYRYRKYRCAGRCNAHVCNAPMILAEQLESVVIGMVTTYLQTNEAEVQQLYEEAARVLGSYADELTKSIDSLTGQIAAQVAERSRLVTAIADLVTRHASDEVIHQLDAAVQRIAKRFT
jgi:hypothetical protein